MTAPSKKPAPTLLAAVRRFVANGGTWEEFIAWTAPEFGAVMREGQINGWSKPKVVYEGVGKAKKERRR